GNTSGMNDPGCDGMDIKDESKSFVCHKNGIGTTKDEKKISNDHQESPVKVIKIQVLRVKKYSIHPILIIDNVAKIAEKNPVVVERLQYVLKLQSLYHDASSFSRCIILCIGDFSKDETLAYLVNHRKMDARIAKRIFDLCWGRISHIVDVTFEIDKLIDQRKKKINGIKQFYQETWDTCINE
ncbi:2915_t:CDS:2, partial [Racocetra fulgida]